MSRPSLRVAWSLALLLGVSALLAACGGAAPSTVPPSPPTSVAVSTTPTAAPGVPATATPAAKPTATAAPRAAIKVGVLQAMTGSSANIGKDQVDALGLYLESISSTVAGRKLELIVVDTRIQADVALTKARQLVESDKVQILMGLNSTPECNAVATYAKEVGVPVLITGACGSQNLLADPKIKSPYVARFTHNMTGTQDPTADWAYKQGYRKAIIVSNDYAGGLEIADAFASAFVARGGSIVQELYPALGTTDYGPFVAQMASNTSADLIWTFVPGIGGLRFMQQWTDYRTRKLPVIDANAAITAVADAPEAKDALDGMFSGYVYTPAIDNPANRAFVKAWEARYPGRAVSSHAAQAYSGVEILAGVLSKVEGSIERKQDFLEALYKVNVQTIKGPVKLDADHDVVQNMYVFQLSKQGDQLTQKIVATYPEVSRGWSRTPQELATFPFGKVKGKWVGMTKEQLAKLGP